MADITSPAIGPSLPSTALPVSGSRGLSPGRHSQPLRLPRSIASFRIGLGGAKSIQLSRSVRGRYRLQDVEFAGDTPGATGKLLVAKLRIYPAGDVCGATFMSV
jgi:hypothetical protein